MAASDQTYRNQHRLDIVFAVSNIVMLLTVIIMFSQDFYREFKVEQREFRDVESAMAERAMLRALPDQGTLQQIDALEKEVKGLRDELSKVKSANSSPVNTALAARIRAETHYQGVKADYDSLVSLRDIAVDERGLNDPHAVELSSKVATLKQQLDVAKADFDEKSAVLDKAMAPQTEVEKKLSDTEDRLKKLRGDFDRFHKLALDKEWGWGDWLRALPVIDGFASPYRIQQVTLEDLPIDYNFKQVTRYDRCTTCHLGIDRASYTKDSLRGLKEAPNDLKARLDGARGKIQADLPKQMQTLAISEARVNEFCAHPRLDLFVDGNSPHPSEKFGCTSCHSGQGSATDFNMASHAPNNVKEREEWVKRHSWASNHYWDFPMMPKRFVESSCIKCHYEVTDLVRGGNRVEAPKVVRGYNLVRDNGCFGCHEIPSVKGGRKVGPDMRLEPDPPLEALTPTERVKATSDPLNPPGTYRKVGPSLRRISEKTHESWTRQWVYSPRGFRPDTRMPHFYNLSTNSKDVLPEDQKEFPNAEIHSIVHYLFEASRINLRQIEQHHKDTDELRDKDQKIYAALTAKSGLDDKEKQELEGVSRRMQQREMPLPIAQQQLPAAPKDDKERAQRERRGRTLFQERGCMACHTHNATSQSLGTRGEADFIPPLEGEAHFGPNLSRLTAKLGSKPGDADSARRWLIQWIMDPTVHHPRTFMPVTFLDRDEADAVATWLLSQKSDYEGPDLPEPTTKNLRDLAEVHLKRVFTAREVKSILEGDGLRFDRLARPDADERELVGDAAPDEHKLKMYIGRKAINQLGCYGCHSIPGFEAAKPIGTPLNDWGKKDAERIAFEDIIAYVKSHHNPAALRDDPKDPSKPAKEWQYQGDKSPYEEFFLDALQHHQREGFLHQKLSEPRSYDYNRNRAWDERLRMPQFRFSRQEAANDASAEEKARVAKNEADAREAVMTFVLGLVAEPVPNKFVNRSEKDRLAEVKGRQVLDKFNCAGCHLVRPGTYEFNPGPVMTNLESAFQVASGSDAYRSDFHFPDHNAWVGQTPTRADLLRAHGVALPMREEDDPNLLRVRLTSALRFMDSENQLRDIPASYTIPLPTDKVTQHEPLGGTFTNFLATYLTERYPEYKDKRDDAMAAGPPPLHREGERVQSSWLYQFLRNPSKIRPLARLRMPRFNMSEEDATALVNYFAAMDRTNNPATGLNYPYESIPQRNQDFWSKRTERYVAGMSKETRAERIKSLQPYWEQMLRDRVAETERNIKAAEEAAKEAKEEADKKAFQTRVETLKKELDQQKGQMEKKDYKAFDDLWVQEEGYAADGYRLLTNSQLCLKCHQVGTLIPAQNQGPALHLVRDRLRPDWTMRWIANPVRFMNYNPVMPQNFPSDKVQYEQSFVGKGYTRIMELEQQLKEVKDADKKKAMEEELRQLKAAYSLSQIQAVTDALMNLGEVAELPPNRYYRLLGDKPSK